ncbi:hypothetical protein [Nitratifractor sp.]
MKKIIQSIILLLIAISFSEAQIIKCKNANLKFTRTYVQKFPKSDMPLGPGVRLSAVLQTPDQGYLVGGKFVQDQNNTGKGGYDAWLMRVDPRGVIKWSKVFYKKGKTPYNRDEFFKQIVSLGDGRYAALGQIPFWNRYGSYHHFPMIVLFDAKGKILWKKYFYLPYQMTDIQSLTIQSIVPLSSGNLLAVGQGAVRFWDEEKKSHYYVNIAIAFKVDRQGKILFAKAYNHKVFSDEGHQWGFNNAVEKEGALYIVGGTSWAGTGHDERPDSALLLKTDSEGNPVWAMEYYRQIDGNMGNGFKGITATPDGLLLTYESGYSGSVGHDINLLKVNDDGTVVSGKYFSDHSYYIYLSDLKKSRDGNYLFSSIDTGVTKVDKDGNPLRQLYPEAANFAVTRDNGVVAIKQDVWDNWTSLKKVNRVGKGCDVEAGETPKATDITDQIATVYDSSDDIYVRDLGAMRAKPWIAVHKSRPVEMRRNCLTSYEGFHPKNPNRFFFRETNRTDVIDGKECKRYLLRYKGKVTGIQINPYYDDGNGHMVPGGYVHSFYTKVFKPGECGDNTCPRFVYPPYAAATKDHINSVVVDGFDEERNASKIAPFIMNGHAKRLWIVDGWEGSWAKGYYITILNGRKDATVLKYDKATKKSRLIKLPCNRK